jgi:hypothetical protein
MEEEDDSVGSSSGGGGGIFGCNYDQHIIFSYFPYHFTILLAFLPYFSISFHYSPTFLLYFPYHFTILLNSEKIWKIRKKGKLNSEKI